MHIDIFSDVICPWCFIGKRRLERALTLRPQPGLTRRWRAFQLNPDMPAEGMERQRYLAVKFGGAGNAKSIYAQVEAAGETEGIAFAFDSMKRTPNTVDAHRLIRFAASQDREDAVVEGLFDTYFLRAEDIGDRDVLVAVAQAAGLDDQAVRTYLSSDDEVAAVRSEDHAARQAGINGVPCFIFNGQHALAGAHTPEVLFQLFDLAKQDKAEAVQDA